MISYWSPQKQWGMALALILFDILLVLFWLHRPTWTLAGEMVWDFRIAELRHLPATQPPILSMSDERAIQALAPHLLGLSDNGLTPDVLPTWSWQAVVPPPVVSDQNQRDARGQVL